jgi:hypothetical protein
MTRLLEEALATLARLSERDQEALAAMILEELESESRWNEAFAGSQAQMARLADDALVENATGKTELLDLDPR